MTNTFRVMKFLRPAGPVLVLALAGCATVGRAPMPGDAPDSLRRCASLFESVEQAVVDAGVRDDEAHVIEGHPWYRSSRFLASFREEARDAGLDQWLGLMAGLDERARRHELANLPRRQGVRLGDDVRARLDDCRERLVAYDRSRPSRVEALRQAAVVPDAYIAWRRVLGIYPLSGWFILQGVEDWQEEEIARFARPPMLEDAKRYAPRDGTAIEFDEVGALLRRAADNALGIPLPRDAAAQGLLRAFAPVFVIETAGEFDRPGRPARSGDGVTVEPEPVVYARISHTRYRGDSLLQLNYLVWFSARPRTGAFDMLGGRLDGVYWRVTLGPDGRPLLYDSMHACGCYHMAFPTDRLEPRPPRGGLDEPLLVPKAAPAGEGRIVLYLESGTHYLVGVQREPAPVDGVGYTLAAYHDLRSLPGGRSLFGEHGIVPGTDRREEIFFWTTGVRAPGAMRQWGTHATAFVGRRHFDDPGLIERYFRPAGSGNGR